MLYPPPFLDEIRRLSGARHAFLKQLAEPGARRLRAWVEAEVAAAPADVARAWTERLTSLDNRRFFQAFAEVVAVRLLRERGWRVVGRTGRGRALAVLPPRGGPRTDLVVAALLRQVRPEADRAVVGRLCRALDRVGSRARIAVLVRRPLPPDFDPEPVRRAVDLWLAEVDRGGWDERTATYEDGPVSLEFALTGGRAAPGGRVVAFALGPLDGQRVLEALEARLVQDLERLRAAGSSRPSLAAVVAWPLLGVPPGGLRDLAFGRPARQLVEEGVAEYVFADDPAPALFRDPVYRHLSGLVVAERAGDDELTARSFLNPWARSPLRPEDLPGPTWAAVRREGAAAVVRRLPGDDGGAR